MYDLIIVGGGPAGSASGRIAGQQNLKTLLLEKQTFPRYKPCGGAFSEQAMSYLDFVVPDHLQERNIFGARVHYGGQVIEQHKNYRIATLITRSVLDKFLLQKAQETGIEVKLGEKVINITEEPDCVEVHTTASTYKSRFVIIAEGSKGRLKYLVRKKDKKNAFGIAVVTEIPHTNRAIDDYIYKAVDIHFGVTEMGYGWVFPHEKYLSVGIGGLAQYLPKPQEVMRNFLRTRGFDTHYKLKTHLIPSGGIKRQVFTGRIVLCGDSAGFVDPFYGEGIAYAIRSGQIAAKTISKIVLNNMDLNTLSEYEYECKKEFGDNLKYSLMLTRLMHKFPNIFFKLFTGNERIINKYLEIPAIKGTYRQYIKWLIPRVPMFLLQANHSRPA